MEDKIEGKSSKSLGKRKRSSPQQGDYDTRCTERNSNARWKVFNDPIHGLIEIHPLLNRIIDTPQFQRLRNIKQLGAVYFVYPGATHNRFEHSIGVSHLAGLLLDSLRRRQPELPIDEKDVLCVKIAGLCHDLGHGPFSHLFDDTFIRRVNPDSTWKHEKGSTEMLQHMIEKNDLMKEFEKYGLGAKDITFIKEQVAGAKVKQPNGGQTWPYEGRDQEKGFLYEIVANKRNGIDVDKWEYLARDCYMVGIKTNFDHLRCMHFVRAIKVDGYYQICGRDKEADNLYDMFHTRYNLHRRACKHRVVKIIDYMLIEAMEKANDYIFFEGKDGVLLKMSDTINDMEAFCKLTDHVFLEIYHSKRVELKDSREILQNILKRKLYKSAGQTQLIEEQAKTLGKESEAKIKKELIEKLDQDKLKSSGFQEDDVVVNMIPFDYGMKDKNPIDNVRFYTKDDPNTAKRILQQQVSQMLTNTFSEAQIQVFYKKADEQAIEMIKIAFAEWCREKKFPQPKDNRNPEMVLSQE